MSDARDKKATAAQIHRLGRRLFGYLRNYRLLFLGTILVMLLLSAVDRSRYFLFQPLIDGLPRMKLKDLVKGKVEAPKPGQEDPEQAWKTLRKLACVAFGIAVLIFPLKFLAAYLANYISQRVLLDIRNDLALHLLRLPLSFFHDRKSGDLLSRLTNDTMLMQQAAGFFFEDLFLQPFNMLGGIALMLWANWKLGLIALVCFPLYALPIAKLGKAMRRTRKKSLEKLGGMTESVMQMYSGIRIVKAFNMEKDEAREFKEVNESFFRKVMSMVRKKALSEGIMEVLVSLGFAVVFLVAGVVLLEKGMTVGQMGIFVVAMGLINTPVKELTKGYNRLQESLAAADRLFEVMDAPPERPDPPDAVPVPTVESVEYRGVWFAYNSEPVLRDINLSVKPGEMIAVVGKSGAGKSTLVDLLCRFYDPQKGEVALNGIDLRRVRRASLLSHIAVVSQDPFLFNATIGENIRYGKPGAFPAEVEAAAKAAFIHDFITTAEKGYDTVTGERGAKLSGGQRQRIAIARAILKNPSILILDEATSALDVESEQAVQAALDNLIHSGRRITFVIAHRLSTIKNADRIIVLDGGKLVEEGTHGKLLDAGGVYASLYKTQFGE